MALFFRQDFNNNWDYCRDVSSESKRGYIKGKTFELQKDINLYQLSTSDHWYVDKNMFFSDRQTEKYAKIETIDRGTQLIVIKVLGEDIKHESEFNKQTIIAKLTNSKGEEIEADISSLFENIFQNFDENIGFIPDANYLKEINE